MAGGDRAMNELFIAETFHGITDAFTPEEIEKYSTIHWRMVGNHPDPDRYAHAWQTIGGKCRYLGTTEDLAAGREPAEQLPLVPALDMSDVEGGGPTVAEGGMLPWQRENPPTTID